MYLIFAAGMSGSGGFKYLVDIRRRYDSAPARQTHQDHVNETEFVRAVRLFQRRPAAAEAYLAIKSQTARSMYLRAELEEFRAASENGHSTSAPSSGSA